MADIDWGKWFRPGKKDYQSGYTVFDEHAFLVEFWTDSWGLKWVRLSEMRGNEETLIREAWTKGDRVSWTKQQIETYLEEEKNAGLERSRIEEFCRTGRLV